MAERMITYNGETHSKAEWFELLGIRSRKEDSHAQLVKRFAEQVKFKGAVSNKMLYTMFIEWAGASDISKGSFAKRVPTIFRELRPDIESYRNNHERGWRCD